MSKFKFLMTAAAAAGALAVAGTAQATSYPCTGTVECSFDGLGGGLKVYVPGKAPATAFSEVTDSFAITFASAGTFTVSPTSAFKPLSFAMVGFDGQSFLNPAKKSDLDFVVSKAGTYNLLVTTKNTGAGQAQYSASFAFAAVPEPATWGMMIAGVGMAGGALRRRRPARVAVA